MKKLSDYNRLDGLRIMGKITKIIRPLTEDEGIVEKISGMVSPEKKSIDKDNKADVESYGLSVMLGIADVLCSEYPEYTLKIIAAINQVPEEQCFDGNLFDALNDITVLVGDKILLDFLSQAFGLGRTTQSDTSQSAEILTLTPSVTTSDQEPTESV